MSNADTLRRVFALMDERNDPAVRELLAPGFSAVIGGNPPMSVDEWAGMGDMMYAAFTDGRHTIEETFEIGDRVVLRGSFSGTHAGEFVGMAPTGKDIAAEVDMAGLMQQLGAIPAVA